jgi:hypothetical protein
MLLKFLLITFLVIFVVIRLGGFVFRALFWMLGARAGGRNIHSQPHPGQRPQPRTSTGEINIDYVPDQNTKNKKAGFYGGEYVDYEEVK